MKKLFVILVALFLFSVSVLAVEQMSKTKVPTPKTLRVF